MKHLELLIELYRALLKLRHSGSFFGFLWTLLNPTVYILIYWFVFSYVLQVGSANYYIFLITGFLGWNFTFGSLNLNSEAINQSKYLITKIAFPHELIVISNTLILLTDMIIAYAAFFILVLILSPSFAGNFIYFPLILIPQIFFTLGISFIASALSVYFKDIPKLVAIFGNIMFFISPILYPIERIPSNFSFVVNANLFAYILNLYHQAIYKGDAFNIVSYSFVFLSSSIIFLSGLWVFNKYKAKFAELA